MTVMTGETRMPASDAADMTVRVSRIIHAPRDRVFQAWLDPELRRQWWVTHGNGRLATCEIDARVGGKYRQSQIGGCDDVLECQVPDRRVATPPRQEPHRFTELARQYHRVDS